MRFRGFDFDDSDDKEEALDVPGRERQKDEGLQTRTSEEQRNTEDMVEPLLLDKLMFPGDHPEVFLQRDEHCTYLLSCMEGLSGGHAALDASRPWLCYWIAHALDLLGSPLSPSLARRMVEFLRRCMSPTGGFAGGPQQLAHLAPTYAASVCLACLGRTDGWKMVDRKLLYQWLLKVKMPNGGFAMHEGGEVDVRATYCALVVARLFNLATPELLSGVAEYVIRCQTYEGGFAGFPGNEAHGGYTFCGSGAAALLGIMDRIDADALVRWVALRQMRFEGGFSGRTNKLVDSCYSFWQGAALVIASSWLETQKTGARSAVNVESVNRASGGGDLPFNQIALQQYLLLCCQNNRGTGGMIDKPGKMPDVYHTCYALSGLSLAQHNTQGSPTVYGNAQNLVQPINPVFNVVRGKAEAMMEHFSLAEPPT